MDGISTLGNVRQRVGRHKLQLFQFGGLVADIYWQSVLLGCWHLLPIVDPWKCSFRCVPIKNLRIVDGSVIAIELIIHLWLEIFLMEVFCHHHSPKYTQIRRNISLNGEYNGVDANNCHADTENCQISVLILSRYAFWHQCGIQIQEVEASLNH